MLRSQLWRWVSGDLDRPPGVEKISRVGLKSFFSGKIRACCPGLCFVKRVGKFSTNDPKICSRESISGTHFDGVSWSRNGSLFRFGF